MSKLIKIQRIVEKWMLYIIASSIILGILFGFYFPLQAALLKPWIPATLFLMLYPMMVGINLEQLARAAQNKKIIRWSIIFNFIVSPLLGFLIAALMLRSNPAFAVALILLAATPCAGMVVGWTGLAKGNSALALVIVAMSLLLSIITIPLTMRLLAGTLVTVSIMELFKGTFLIIVVPLILGDLTRRIIIRRSGQPGFLKVKPLLPSLSMLGMFSILFISLAIGADNIIAHWKSIFIIFAAVLVFYLLQVTLALLLVRRTGIATADGIALVYSVLGKNISLAVGLAANFFSPLTVAMLAVNPLVQAPFMAWFMRWSMRHWSVQDLKEGQKQV